jgi:hypothetical protein
MNQHSKDPTTKELYDEIIKMRKVLDRLPKKTPFWKHLGFFFVRGIIMGLGWMVAFALLIPVLAMVLRFFVDAPVVGDLLDAVIDRVIEHQRIVP